MTAEQFMSQALRHASRGYGMTSPNPMVGAVLVKGGRIIGLGWHQRAGGPHAEINALRDAAKRGHSAKGATLYVTLEPCSTHGRTPPCTDAIIAAGIKRVVVGATDPNPKHAGKGFRILRQAGIEVAHGVLADECARLNEAFNHWIVHHTPFVTAKAAMTLDGKIATRAGESKWITGEQARSYGMKLRRGADAILVGVNTILADDPSLTYRTQKTVSRNHKEKALRRIVLDSMARTPPTAKVISDSYAAFTTIVVSRQAPKSRVQALAKRVNVLVAPLVKAGSFHQPRSKRRLNLPWLLRRLGSQNVTHLLIEGGGDVNASFLFGGLVQRIAFFYAPKILGGRDACPGVGGAGATRPLEILQLRDVQWHKVGTDRLLTARLEPQRSPRTGLLPDA